MILRGRGGLFNNQFKMFEINVCRINQNKIALISKLTANDVAMCKPLASVTLDSLLPPIHAPLVELGLAITLTLVRSPASHLKPYLSSANCTGKKR